MIKKINCLLLITAIILAYNCFSLYRESKPAGRPDSASQQAAISSLYRAAADIFPRFFNEKDMVGFYSRIDSFAKEHRLRLASVIHKTSQENSFALLNLKKTVFTISVSGRYADLKNFIYQMESQRLIDSLDSLKISPVISSASGASGDIAAEIKYSLYSFVSLKSIRTGERTSVSEFSKILSASEAAPVGKSLPVDIFSADCFKSASDKTAVVKKNSPQDVSAKSAPATGEISLKPVPAKPSRGRKNSQALVYTGYYFDSKKGIKAFVEFNGRVNIVSAGSALGDSYTVTRLDESSVAIANREEPFDTMEARLNEAAE
ncbi:MAG TPA: hypothetical protein PKW98_19715 [Candidatus Wallbacteria bacterium]|nr:hypothetical protein [Candidatus Wallbacteria bacterium]